LFLKQRRVFACKFELSLLVSDKILHLFPCPEEFEYYFDGVLKGPLFRQHPDNQYLYYQISPYFSFPISHNYPSKDMITNNPSKDILTNSSLSLYFGEEDKKREEEKEELVLVQQVDNTSFSHYPTSPPQYQIQKKRRKNHHNHNLHDLKERRRFILQRI